MRDAYSASAAVETLRCNAALLATQPDVLQARVAVIAAACDCSQSQALKLVTHSKSAASSLLECTTEQIEQRMAALRECMGGCSQQTLLAVCRAAGRGLTLAPETMRARRQALASVLALEADALTALLVRRPGLLAALPESVHESVEAVQQMLELQSWEEAVEVAVTRMPSILTSNAGAMRDGVGWLRRRLAMPVEELASHMILLGKPSEVLEERLAALPAALGITQDDALELVRQGPTLLLVQTSTVAGSWKVLRRAAALQPRWRQLLLEGSVSQLVTLLRTHPTQLQERVDAVLAASPTPDDIPALASMLKNSPVAFRAQLAKLRAGSYRPRAKASTLLSSRLPASLAQQL